jgi:Flp pilus assembly pilin Flp
MRRFPPVLTAAGRAGNGCAGRAGSGARHRNEVGATSSEYLVVAGVVVVVILTIMTVFHRELSSAITTITCNIVSAVGGGSGGCGGGGSAPAAAAAASSGGSVYIRAGAPSVNLSGLSASAVQSLATQPPPGSALPGATSSVPTLSNVSPAVRSQIGMEDLRADLESVNQGLVGQNYYVRNRFQGDPTLVGQGLYNLVSIGWDNTAGWVTGSKGVTCGDYVELTYDQVRAGVEKQFPGAKVEKWLFEEKSTNNPSGLWNNADALNEENHNVIKVTLPDGTQWGVDFHQHNINSSKPILRPWNELKQEWIDYLGKDEFTEGPV